MTAVDVAPSQICLVTGAGRGLGRHLAVGLAAEGLAVAVLGRTANGLQGVVQECRDAGAPRVVAVTADVRDFAAVAGAVAQVVQALGPVELLVNNAGVIEPVEVPIWQADPEQWWDVVETDLRGPFHCIRAVVPHMVTSGGGRVVNLNSGAGASDRAVYSAYCAAKAALFRLSGNLHLAGHSLGLRAFDISPGVVPTGMTAAMAVHASRTEWTPPAAVVDLVRAVARGDLDLWSGCYLRAGIDTLDHLAEVARAGHVPGDARRLRVLPIDEDDAAPG